MRVIHAVRELNAQRAEPIRVIALYTEAERDAMFVRHADEAGSALTRRLPRPRRRWSARCARRAPTPPGSGGASSPSTPSSPSCASASASSSSARTPRSCACVGDKIAAKRLAEEAGVPVAPWSGGPVATRRRGAAPRGAHRLPADDQGRRRRRRARHPPRRRARRARRPRSPARRPRRSQAFGDGTRAAGEAHHAGPPRRGADRRRRPRRRVGRRPARLLLPAPQPEGHRGVRQPGADRRPGARGPARPRGGWRCAPATATPARSSSSTSPTPRASRSWRSTRACRSSIP